MQEDSLNEVYSVRSTNTNTKLEKTLRYSYTLTRYKYLRWATVYWFKVLPGPFTFSLYPLTTISAVNASNKRSLNRILSYHNVISSSVFITAVSTALRFRIRLKVKVACKAPGMTLTQSTMFEMVMKYWMVIPKFSMKFCGILSGTSKSS
jgi:hypothetical protein